MYTDSSKKNDMTCDVNHFCHFDKNRLLAAVRVYGLESITRPVRPDAGFAGVWGRFREYPFVFGIRLCYFVHTKVLNPFGNAQ